MSTHDNEEKIITNQSSYLQGGIYVNGEIDGVVIPFLIDTGASRTILSKKLFDSLPRDRKIIVKEDALKLQLADGTPMPLKGTVVLPFKI